MARVAAALAAGQRPDPAASPPSAAIICSSRRSALPPPGMRSSSCRRTDKPLWTFHFYDQAPQPKESVRIEELETVVYPDRFRVFIHIRVTLFEERPNLLLTARTRRRQDRRGTEHHRDHAPRHGIHHAPARADRSGGRLHPDRRVVLRDAQPAAGSRVVEFVVPEAAE